MKARLAKNKAPSLHSFRRRELTINLRDQVLTPENDSHKEVEEESCELKVEFHVQRSRYSQELAVQKGCCTLYSVEASEGS